jgi:hypothetical protein
MHRDAGSWGERMSWTHDARIRWALATFGDLVECKMAFGGPRPSGLGASVFYGRTEAEAGRKARRWAQRGGAR